MSTVLGLGLLPATGAAPAEAAGPGHASTSARAKPVTVALKVADQLSTSGTNRAKVVLKRGHGGRLPAGKVVLRSGHRVLAQHKVSAGHRKRIRLTLPQLPQGTHRLVAVFRASGHRIAASSVRQVRLVDGCAWKPSACGYPDATNTGITPVTTLRTLGSQTITKDGTVLENATINGNIEIEANNVTIRNVRITETGDTWGIGLRHTTNTTIDHVQISRGNGTRLEVGIKDVYGDATGTSILHSDISGTSTAIQTHEGLVQDNYVHDLAMNTGDHVNGFTSNGATTPLTINHNTIFNQISQTDAISLFQDFGLEANRTITNNLIAGGGYTLYAGAGSQGASHNITITGNRFSRLYYPNGGSYGPATAYDTNGSGNTWTNNTWDGSGTSVPRG